MFVSRAKWEETLERICKLERNQGIVCGKETVGPVCLPFSGIVIPAHQKDKTISVNQAVSMIIDHLNLKIERTSAKMELVSKEETP